MKFQAQNDGNACMPLFSDDFFTFDGDSKTIRFTRVLHFGPISVPIRSQFGPNSVRSVFFCNPLKHGHTRYMISHVGVCV